MGVDEETVRPIRALASIHSEHLGGKARRWLFASLCADGADVWIPGNKTDKSEVSAPTFWVCRIFAMDDEHAFEGLQFKEGWLYWDTALLAPFLSKDAIAFQTKNVVEEGDAKVAGKAEDNEFLGRHHEY